MDDQSMREMREQRMHQAKQTMEQVEGLPVNVYYAGVLGAIGLSALLFLMGRRTLGIFVGLWPPTILNLALFAKQLRPSQEMEEWERKQQQAA